MLVRLLTYVGCIGRCRNSHSCPVYRWWQLAFCQWLLKLQPALACLNALAREVHVSEQMMTENLVEKTRIKCFKYNYSNTLTTQCEPQLERGSNSRHLADYFRCTKQQLTLRFLMQTTYCLSMAAPTSAEQILDRPSMIPKATQL